MTDLILASGSPRRQALLAALGLDFVVDAADIDEAARAGEAPEALVLRLSRLKAQAVALRHPGVPVLAADTVVVLGAQILGKPADAADATRMLAALRDRVHHVYTAVSLARLPAASGSAASARSGPPPPASGVPDAWPGEIDARLCRSQVWMRGYDAGEMAAYVATGDPLDKAGAYAIQHPLFAPVTKWTGCYAGIMGLPLGLVTDLLMRVQLAMPGDPIAVCEASSGAGACCLRGLPGKC